MAAPSRAFQGKAQFLVERTTNPLDEKRGGEEANWTITTPRGMNCIELLTAEGLFLRRSAISGKAED